MTSPQYLAKINIATFVGVIFIFRQVHWRQKFSNKNLSVSQPTCTKYVECTFCAYIYIQLTGSHVDNLNVEGNTKC